LLSGTVLKYMLCQECQLNSKRASNQDWAQSEYFKNNDRKPLNKPQA